LKPLKKFTDRKAAVVRIWAAIQRRMPEVAPHASDVARAKEATKASSAKALKLAPAPNIAKDAKRSGAEQRSNAEVVAMMKRAKGATRAEIMEATGWQAHTVRGFVSILGSQGGEPPVPHLQVASRDPRGPLT
jgi:Protein of unknown function (DUF3489)